LKILNAGTPPAITSQPGNQSVTANNPATFSVTATGTAPLTYQWYGSPASGGNVWDPIIGATAATLTLPNVPQIDDQTKYRCIVANTYGTATSSAGFLSVTTPTNGAPYIVEDPENASGMVGDSVLFQILAAGTPAPTYQWQKSINGGGSWSSLSNGGEYSGVTTNTLRLTSLTVGDNANLFRCVATNVNGTATSNTASLTVGDPVITEQPSSQNTTVGGTVDFIVTAEGATALSYQWQISAAGGMGWTDLTDGGEYSGSQTSDLTVGPVINADDEDLFRCVVTDTNGSVTSNIVQLTINLPPNPFTVNMGGGVSLQNQNGGTSLVSPTFTPGFSGGYPPFYAVPSPALADYGSAFFNNEGGPSFSISLFSIQGPQGTQWTQGLGVSVGPLEPMFVDSEGQTASAYTNTKQVGMMIMPVGAPGFLGALGAFASPSTTYGETGLASFTGGALAGGGLYTFTPSGPNAQIVTATQTGSYIVSIVFEEFDTAYISPLSAYTL
jgi:hypothetical protein